MLVMSVLLYTGGKMCICHPDNGGLLVYRSVANGCDSIATCRNDALAQCHELQGALLQLPQGTAEFVFFITSET